jgi:DivIVA domain-containing protein
MMWFFAILIVLAMGAVALVAAGRGAPMRPAAPDRAPSGLPVDGPVTAEQLRRVRFPLAFRGYRMDEVDALLDRLAREREEPGQEHTDDTAGDGPGPAA